MFQWDKSFQAINVSADKVVNLFRSMREVQLALPGVPAQQASAYLCQYEDLGGVVTVAVFHLHKSGMLAFYPSEPKVVPQQKTDSMLDQGLNFVESMGFLLTDQDIHLLEASDRQMLWESLPLRAGLMTVESPVPAAPEKAKPAVAATDSVATPKPAESKPSTTAKPEPPRVAAAETMPTVAKEPTDEAGESVDDLLAAVEAMRAKRPGLRARKVAPSAEEMNRRKDQLKQTVGRILASL